MRLVKAFYPGRDLLLSFGPRLFFNDKYAAINRPNDSHLLGKTCFFGLRYQFGQKRPELLAKTFFLVFAIDSSEKRPEFLAKIFLFWSARMVAVRWILVRTKCGPLVQKIVDPWPNGTRFERTNWSFTKLKINYWITPHPIICLMYPRLSILHPALEFDCLFLVIFKVLLVCELYFWQKLAPPKLMF